MYVVGTKDLISSYRKKLLETGGNLESKTNTYTIVKGLDDVGILDSVKFLWTGEMGTKERIDGIYHYAAELYSDSPIGAEEYVTFSGIGSFWSVSLDVYTAAGSNDRCSGGHVSANSLYRISYTISNYAGGTVYFTTEDGVHSGAVRSSNGSYVDIIETTTEGKVYFYGGSDFTGKIKNISIKKIPDAFQSEPTYQPYLSGNIAPNEKLCLKNPNGDAIRLRLEHPNINFTANDPWTITLCVNNNGKSSQFYYNGGTVGGFGLFQEGSLFLYTTTSSTHILGNIAKFYGKTVIINFVYNGVDSLFTYVNGILLTTTSIYETFNVQGLFDMWTDSPCKFYSYIIHTQALTATEVTTEYTLLRSIYPEMESVFIENVHTFNSVTCDSSVGYQFIYPIPNETIAGFGVSVKITYTIVSNNSNCTSLVLPSMDYGGGMLFNTYHAISYAVGTHTYYFDADGTGARNATAFLTNISDSGSIVINNISVTHTPQEWTTSNCDIVTTPMGNIIPNVTDNTAWAALTTPAWCYYSNYPSLGSIYGKLYNWYAISLIQSDIDAYNTANPSTPFGWHVPTSTEFGALVAALGGSSTAGGRMKVAGTDYWITPNTGADNGSGFSVLSGGWRDGGTFGVQGNHTVFWDIDDNANRISYNTSTIYIYGAMDKTFGCSLRLIKD